MANAIFGILGALSLEPVIKDAFPPMDKDATTIRVSLGTGANASQVNFAGDTPGVALWDGFGEPIGTTFGSSKVIDDGSSAEIKVIPNHGVGNIGATYLSLTNGGDDGICVSGVTITFATGQTTAWNANVAAACPLTGAAISYSTETFQGTPTDSVNSSFCVWLDRDGTNGIPHQGLGFRIPDFGELITSEQVAMYNNHSELMCDSGPRFRMYGSLRTEEPILIYADQIQKFDSNGTDVDPGKIIGNPGIFAKQDMIALREACSEHTDGVKNCHVFGGKRAETLGPMQYRSRPRRHHRRRDTGSGEFVPASSPAATNSSSNNVSPSYTNSTITAGKNRFREHCIISSLGQSARYLCNHPNAYGPSFASTTEGLFCDLLDKKLYQICESAAADGKPSLAQEVSDSACFDLSTRSLKSLAMAPKTFSTVPVAAIRNFTQVSYW